MLKKKLKWNILLSIFLLCIVIIPYTLSKYSTKLTKKIIITPGQSEYDVIFNPNPPAGETVSGTMQNQHFIYGTAQNLTINSYEVDGYIFTGWTTKADGTGTHYTDGDLVNNLTSTNGGEFNLYAQWRDYIAEINGTYYKTLQKAVDAVPKDNTKTTIKLLWNTSESITVAQKQNIKFDLQNYTISNNGSKQVIVNNGTIDISNGTIKSSADYAAIDNESYGKINISGGKIIATGNRQAIYNNKGTVEITGGYLSSSIPTSLTDKERGTINNQSTGTLIITGGTIVSTTKTGVYNEGGALTIGTMDNDVDKTTLTIQGKTYGVKSNVSFGFYDGTIKGKKEAINKASLNYTVNTETGYEVTNGTEEIEGERYQTAYLANGCLVTFDPNGGTLSNNTRTVESGETIGVLPEPERSDDYNFDGWFTELEGGTKITEDTIITDDITFFAHWTKIDLAEVDGQGYGTLQEAVSAVSADGVLKIVKLNKNTKENITVLAGQNIEFDLQNYTITNSTSYSVITNNGTVKITNGTIKTTSSTNASAINNNAGGHLTISGGNIIAGGQRQALYNDKGTVEITGGYFTSSITATDKQRGTVHNLAGSTMTITGGTIVSKTQQAVYNLGTMTIGKEDGNVSTVSPEIQGTTYGLNTTTNVKLYDGIIKGGTSAIKDENKITEIETGYQIAHGTETIDSTTYQTAYLEVIE